MEEMQNINEWVEANTNTTSSEVVMESTENTTASINPFDVFMSSLSDLLLNNDDFTYQMIRQSSDYVNDNLDYDDIGENVLGTMDMKEFASEVSEYIDMTELAKNVSYNIDLSDLAYDVKQYMDMDDLASSVQEHLDIAETISDEAYSLLGNYSPGNGCSLGDAFTDAIKNAIEYLIRNNDDVINKIRNTSTGVSAGPVEISDEQSDNTLTDSENAITPAIAPVTVQDHAIEALKRVVHEVLASYVPNYSSDPFMKIRIEAKSFDVFTDYMNGKW